MSTRSIDEKALRAAEKAYNLHIEHRAMKFAIEAWQQVMRDNQPADSLVNSPDAWPANIVAERHEVSGKWVLWYLTDEQAAICQQALPPLSENCQICGEDHEGNVPRGCETGDGE
ncbi:hypothetical protein ACYOEI_01075 [Singulisphaera rosea]